MNINLEAKFNRIVEKYNFYTPQQVDKVCTQIKEMITAFLQNSKNPAIYCNGFHTKMLMSDFIYELQSVKIIIDNGMPQGAQGFRLIKDYEIEKNNVDSVIISSFKFRKEISRQLKKLHPNVRVLDIYEELARNGYDFVCEYYRKNQHPYVSYKKINKLQGEIKKCNNKEKDNLYFALINEYLTIKDIKTAIDKTLEWKNILPSDKKTSLLKDLQNLFDMELKVAEQINPDSVIMLCMDAMRKSDLSSALMPKIYQFVNDHGFSFENMYSFSTSTFESLMPVYAENDNMKAEFGKKESVLMAQCRFAQCAEKKGKKICIYGDVFRYIEGQHIKYSDKCQTICEKIWDFLIDVSTMDGNGLFYIHELYETHYSFPNPYTEDEIYATGTSIFFDFLPQNGGKLQVDYIKQHKDSLRYLDDVLSPIIEKLKCKWVLYADHGTQLFDRNTFLEDISDAEYTCSNQLTRIPFVVFSPKIKCGKTYELSSLMLFNKILMSLLNDSDFNLRHCDFIKIARNRLYNPDFEFLYKLNNKMKYLQAFEAFVFEDGKKLIIFEDGEKELYLSLDDSKIDNCEEIQNKFNIIRTKITVN